MTAEFNLNQYEIDLLEGKHGYPRQWAIQQQLQVGRFFGATDFVEVSQAHIMCDTESLGPAGVQHLEHLASYGKAQRTVVIPAVTDPRGMDFRVYKKFNQKEEFADLERRATTALENLGILMTDTCINYQTVVPPVYGEHIAFGRYRFSHLCEQCFWRARSNFEGGPAGLSAALTGRVTALWLSSGRATFGNTLFRGRISAENALRLGSAWCSNRQEDRGLLVHALYFGD